MKDIIVIGQERTGTSLLCYALSFFNNYRNIGEFFSFPQNENFTYELFFDKKEQQQLFDYYHTEEPRKLLTRIHKNPASALNNLDNVLNTKKIIKILDTQFDYNSKLNFIFEQNLKYIVVKRNDDLAQYVSLKIAKETNVWYNKNTDKIKIFVDIDNYNVFKERKKKFYKKILSRLSNTDFITIEYETDLSNGITDNLLNTLELFISNNQQDVSRTEKNRTRLIKQNNCDISKKIINYQQIKNLL